jgi:hypothetical protein
MLGTNVGAYITSRFALARSLFGVGVGNPGALDGSVITRTDKRPLHLSGKLIVGWKLTMPSGASCAITTVPRVSSDNNTYTDHGDANVTTVTALNSGAAQEGTIEVDVNLIGAPAYLKARTTPVLSASGSSVGEVFAVWAFGGGETIPPTESDQ